MSVIEAPTVEDNLKVLDEIISTVNEESIRLEKAALDHVNNIRKRLDLDPLDKLEPGFIGRPTDCPIAQSVIAGSRFRYLRPLVTHHTRVYCSNKKIVDVIHTDDIQNFISDFDDGAFPLLERIV